VGVIYSKRRSCRRFVETFAKVKNQKQRNKSITALLHCSLISFNQPLRNTCLTNHGHGRQSKVILFGIKS
jgi:hypothetical protein